MTVFTRHRKSASLPSLTLGEYHHLRMEPTIKSLGMTLDKKLLYRRHIEHLAKKCDQFLKILRRCLNYGADIQTSLMLYRKLIFSRIDKGFVLCRDASQTYLAKVNRIQFKALSSCPGAFNSTPMNTFLEKAREFPLKIRRKLFAFRLAFKNHPIFRKICNVSTRVLTEKYWLETKSPILVEIFCNSRASLSHYITFPPFQIIL